MIHPSFLTPPWFSFTKLLLTLQSPDSNGLSSTQSCPPQLGYHPGHRSYLSLRVWQGLSWVISQMAITNRAHTRTALKSQRWKGAP
jgi:hypothetical protein